LSWRPVKKKDLLACLDVATAEIACARKDLEQRNTKKGDATKKTTAISQIEQSNNASERLRTALMRCSQLKERIGQFNNSQLCREAQEDKEDNLLNYQPPQRVSTPDAVRQRDAADEALLADEIVTFLNQQPAKEQLELIDFALRPENFSDLAIIARAFTIRYSNTLQLDAEFDHAHILIAHLQASIDHSHVTALQPPTDLLRILIRAPNNLRRALKLGAVSTVSKRIQGILLISSSSERAQQEDNNPLLALKSSVVAALRALLVDLLFHKNNHS